MVNGVERGQVGEKLPKGWKRVSLGDLCTIQNGYAFKSSTFVKQGIPVIKMGNIAKDCRLKWNPELLSYLPESHLSLHSEFVIAKNDLLITLTDMSPSGEYLGTVAMYDQNIPALLNQRVGKFISISNELDIRYLYFRLCTKDFKRYATCDDTGNLQKNTNPEYLQKYKLSLPPLPEQKRIVGILSDRLSTIDKARTATEAQLKAAKALPAAYLRQMFDSPEAQKWKRKKLGDIALTVQNGIYKSSENYGHGHPFLRMYNIRNSSWNLSLSTLAQVLVDDEELEKFKLKVGDLLISRVNSFELVGKCGWINLEAKDYVFENMLIRVRLIDSVDSLFVAQQMGHRSIKDQIQGVAKQAIGQASINSTDIRSVELPIPALEKQKEISSKLTAKTEQAEKLQQSLQSRLDTINKLPAALLRQAFNGEL